MVKRPDATTIAGLHRFAHICTFLHKFAQHALFNRQQADTGPELVFFDTAITLLRPMFGIYRSCIEADQKETNRMPGKQEGSCQSGQIAGTIPSGAKQR